MRFDSYPLDEHTCKFQVGSYTFDSTLMEFNTIGLNYMEQNQNVILDFSAQIAPLKREDCYYMNSKQTFNFSVSGFEITLRRNRLTYILNYYFPSGMFVIVSWVSFLIPPDSIPGRMALLVTLFLVLINLLSSILSQSPTAETMTAISIWMLACLLFVFGALLGYAGLLITIYWTPQISSNKVYPAEDMKSSKRYKRVDKWLLVSSITLFILFNLIYWIATLQK